MCEDGKTVFLVVNVNHFYSHIGLKGVCVVAKGSCVYGSYDAWLDGKFNSESLFHKGCIKVESKA